MREFRLIDYKEQYEKIQKGEFFLWFLYDKMIYSVTRNRITGALTDYINTYFTQVIDEGYEKRVMSKVLENIDADKVRTEVCSYDLFVSYVRRNIRIWIQESAEEEKENNLKIIRRELEKSGGRPILTEFKEKPAFLLGAVSTDEDYYYVHIDAEYRLGYESCVGSFGKVLDEYPKELEKFNPKNITPKVSECVYRTLMSALAIDTEIFFTPIYFDFMGKYEKENFEIMGFVLT